MKKIGLGFIIAANLVSYAAFADLKSEFKFDAVTKIRAAAALNSDHCKTCEVVPTKSTEFSNGNTDVQIQGPVSGLTVSVVVPEELKADDAMELLIQVRALKSQGAHEIAVEVVGTGSAEKLRVIDSSGQVIPLDLNLLLSTAGADYVLDTKTVHDIGDLSLSNSLTQKSENKKLGLIEKNNYVVNSVGHESLASELAEKLDLKMLGAFGAPAEPKGVILVSTQALPVNEMYLKTLSRAEELRRGGYQVHLVMSYVPYARSDKMDRPGVTPTIALAADLLRSTGPKGISYVRAHAAQTSGLYAGLPQRETMSFKTLKNAVQAEDSKIDLIVAPDAGAQKEATKVADLFGVPVAVINKQREGDKTVIRGISLPSQYASLKGLHVLIVDDETASGGTLRDAAGYLKELGAEIIYASVTHLAGSPVAAIEKSPIAKLFVTNSIPVETTSPKLKVVSIADELATDIKGLLWGQALRCAVSVQH